MHLNESDWGRHSAVSWFIEFHKNEYPSFLNLGKGLRETLLPQKNSDSEN